MLRAVGEIAPEADLAAVQAGLPLREQLDLDSMDLLNVVVALHETLGVEIPEADYPRLATLTYEASAGGATLAPSSTDFGFAVCLRFYGREEHGDGRRIPGRRRGGGPVRQPRGTLP